MPMETCAHRTLKSLAIAFLREAGCAAVATEVRCPISRFKIDVAGYGAPPTLGNGSARRNGVGLGGVRQRARTIVIECKQSRSDFLRDNQRLPRLLELRAQLDRIRSSIEEHRIKALEPQLRRSGSSLFRDMEEWDFSSSRMRSYQRVLQRLSRIDDAIHGQTKFFLLTRYALADLFYIAAPRGMIRRSELPPGWGLLECEADQWLRSHAQGELIGEAPCLRIAHPAPPHASKPVRRLRMLRNIAIAASRTVV